MTGEATVPCLGLIVPPAHGRVPDDGRVLYGDRVRFVARGLGLAEISTRGYEEVIDHVVALAGELAAEGAQAISLMGTSLSFFRGARFAEELQAALAAATGLPFAPPAGPVSHGGIRVTLFQTRPLG
jgi:arylmalonate decarboxylase